MQRSVRHGEGIVNGYFEARETKSTKNSNRRRWDLGDLIKKCEGHLLSLNMFNMAAEEAVR